MPRGKHHKTGYNWGVGKHEQTTITVPKSIAKEAKECAQRIWEEKREQEQLKKSEEE